MKKLLLFIAAMSIVAQTANVQAAEIKNSTYLTPAERREAQRAQFIKAIADNNLNLVDLYLNDGVNAHSKLNFSVNGKTFHGWTPLMLAAYLGHADIVKRILETDPVTNFTNNEGETAEQLAKNDEIRNLIKQHIDVKHKEHIARVKKETDERTEQYMKTKW